MTFKERFDLLLNRNKVIKIVIHTQDRRCKTYIRRLDGNLILINDMNYVVKYDLVSYEGGVPTLHYLHDQPKPFNMLEGNVDTTITASQINAVMNNKIFNNIIADLLNRDKKLINTMLIIGGTILLALGLGIYFIYEQLQYIILFIEDNKELLEALRDALLNGVFVE